MKHKTPLTKEEQRILEVFSKLIPLLGEKEKLSLLRAAEGACFLKSFQNQSA